MLSPVTSQSLLVSTAPFALYGDALEYSTVQDSEKLFSLLRTRAYRMRSSPLWRTTNFRISFVTLCNRLQKRLSKSQNTRIAGELLLLQAYLIPVSERGGLNIQGRFNIANQTLTSSFDDSDHHGLENGKASSEGLVDKRFYEMLWSLQEYFSNPLLLNSDPESPEDTAVTDDKTASASAPAPEKTDAAKGNEKGGADGSDAMQLDDGTDSEEQKSRMSHFSRFCRALHEVLTVFESSTLTRQDARAAQELSQSHEQQTALLKSSAISDPGDPGSIDSEEEEEEDLPPETEDGGDEPGEEENGLSTEVPEAEEQTPKYLTGPKLMHLQLRDPEFRRTLLLQTQFLLQFLLPPHQFHSLSDLRYLDRGEVKSPQPVVETGGLPRAKLARPLTEQQVRTCRPDVISSFHMNHIHFLRPNHFHASVASVQRARLEALQIRTVRLLSRTPPDATHFTSSLDFLLGREKLWVQFKNQGAKFGLGDFGRDSEKDPVGFLSLSNSSSTKVLAAVPSFVFHSSSGHVLADENPGRAGREGSSASSEGRNHGGGEEAFPGASSSDGPGTEHPPTGASEKFTSEADEHGKLVSGESVGALGVRGER